MKQWFGRTLLQGLLAILPLVLTAYIIIWLLGLLETSIGSLLVAVLPAGWYWRGMGIVLGLLLVFGVGLLINVLIFQQLLRLAEMQLERIPMVKTVYGAMRDLFAYFSQTRTREQNQVVVMTVAGSKILGVVTRESFADLPSNIAAQGSVAVYFPMSYQIGGYTLMVPREKLEPVDMTFEEAMKFILTAGVTAEPGETVSLLDAARALGQPAPHAAAPPTTDAPHRP